MSICKTNQAITSMEYWVGYKEKATSAAAYLIKDKSVFTANAGSGNYTYMGQLCGVQGGEWCAMTVSEAVYSACGNSKADAKTVLWGVWPYTACNQVWDAAPSYAKHRRSTGYVPKPGDIIIFTNDQVTRTHTGMVYKCDGKTVYTIEGNVGNMCQRLSYALSTTKIYGYVTPKYADADFTSTTSASAMSLTKGDTGTSVKEVQNYLIKLRYSCGSDGADGDFGANTLTAVKQFQKDHGLTVDGVVGAKTLAALKNSVDSAASGGASASANLPVLKAGSAGGYVTKMQEALIRLGYSCGSDGADGDFGTNTLNAVMKFQEDKGLTVDGIVGSQTWAALGM